ncbi:MAG: qor [Rickettsiaceae bacterium]|jgi:NADPH2:quinone reductase|nr:qor [Rickettsiaceae bacterium]
MPKAIIVRETGGPEVMKLENVATPKAPGPGQVLLRHTAIGVNFLDVYYRSGLYKTPRMPMIPGMEACGVVEAVGPGVSIPVGTRVVYATAQTGAYCEMRLINERHLVGVPEKISDATAAAVFTKALTAHYLIFHTYKVRKGNTILVHAAAGGVGQIICQWAKYLGAKVIGTVGTPEKAIIARNNGCDHVIVYTQQNFAEEVMKITNNQGVVVVYDSVGKATFAKSLSCLMNMGLMVSYGQSSGEVPPFNILNLAQKGLYLTRPTLMLYKSTRQELLLSAIEIFQMIERGVLKVSIGQKYPLEKAAQAHADLEARKTTGSTILTV